MQHGFNIRRVVHQAAHLLLYWAQFGDGQIGQRRLEGTEALAAKFAQNRVYVRIGKRRINPN